MGAALPLALPVIAAVGAAMVNALRGGGGPSHAPDQRARQEAEREAEGLRRQQEEARQRAEELRRQQERERRAWEEEEARLRQQQVRQRQQWLQVQARLEQEHEANMAQQRQQAAAELAQMQAERERAEAELQERRRQHEEERQRQEEAEAHLQREAERLELALEETHRRAEELAAQAAREWPRPAWLPQNGVNLGITGRSGVGKSSLVNAVLGLQPGQPGAAPVGAVETTRVPTAYEARGGPLAGLRLWDLPGAGTLGFPAVPYVRQMGLRHFHALVVVNADRFEETDLAIFQEARRWGIPSYLVRSKVDRDIADEREDNGRSPAETLQRLRNYVLEEAGRGAGPLEEPERVFLVSARPRHEDVLRPELERLLRMVARDLEAAVGGAP